MSGLFVSREQEVAFLAALDAGAGRRAAAELDAQDREFRALPRLAVDDPAWCEWCGCVECRCEEKKEEDDE